MCIWTRIRDAIGLCPRGGFHDWEVAASKRGYDMRGETFLVAPIDPGDSDVYSLKACLKCGRVQDDITTAQERIRRDLQRKKERHEMAMEIAEQHMHSERAKCQHG